MSAHSDTSRARIAQGLRFYHGARKRAALLGPSDLARFRRAGVCSPQLAPIVDAGLHEGADLIEALGGLEHVTPQKRALVEDVVALGVALRALVGLFVQGETPSPELASRLSPLASARRAGLLALGLDRVAHDVKDLGAYLDEQPVPRKRNGARRDPSVVAADAPIDVDPSPVLAAAGDRPAEGSLRDLAPDEPEGEGCS